MISVFRSVFLFVEAPFGVSKTLIFEFGARNYKSVRSQNLCPWTEIWGTSSKMQDQMGLLDISPDMINNHQRAYVGDLYNSMAATKRCMYEWIRNLLTMYVAQRMSCTNHWMCSLQQFGKENKAWCLHDPSFSAEVNLHATKQENGIMLMEIHQLTLSICDCAKQMFKKCLWVHRGSVFIACHVGMM